MIQAISNSLKDLKIPTAIDLSKGKLNLTDITGLELENKVKYIYIDKDKNVEIDFK